MVKPKKDDKIKILISDILNKIKNDEPTIEFLSWLIFVIGLIGYIIYTYFNSFFKNFEFEGLVTNWIFKQIIIVPILAILTYHLLKKVLYNKANFLLKKIKKGRLFSFVNYIKKLILNLKGWTFVLIFLALTIAVIGNGLFPVIFQKSLPTLKPLEPRIYTHILGGNPQDSIYPHVSNINCQSLSNKDVYLMGNTVFCSFVINQQNSTYSFSDIKLSTSRSNFNFSDTTKLYKQPCGDSICFFIKLAEPQIRNGVNTLKLDIEFKDRYGIDSTLYIVQPWEINVLSQEQYDNRNYKKFAYLFGLFAFSLVTGLSIVKNLKNIVETKK